ncbi:MAG TPA: hypothetical protein VLE73_01220 [Candidatus Saccharimonadales bacterium]|nr:hypothetical protein [Candidatus Saccharimonadales bacterium]
MTQCYVEIRSTTARGTDSVTADVMRHVYARQHLGKVVIISEEPPEYVAAARKQWLKLSRSLQKERAGTLNADKILKYTHTITRMQHMHFTTQSPLDEDDAEAYFLPAAGLAVMPLHCYTVYLLTPIDMALAEHMVQQLPPGALVVDYNKAAVWEEMLGLTPKRALESRVAQEWHSVVQFLNQHQIRIAELLPHTIRAFDAMDTALDELLAYSNDFLPRAGAFQRALELARPYKASKEQRAAYDTLILLAHRVQALSPGDFSRKFLESYDENDTFFLYDRGRPQKEAEPLAAAYARHMQAGRVHLARALLANHKHMQPLQ